MFKEEKKDCLNNLLISQKDALSTKRPYQKRFHWQNVKENANKLMSISSLENYATAEYLEIVDNRYNHPFDNVICIKRNNWLNIFRHLFIVTYGYENNFYTSIYLQNEKVDWYFLRDSGHLGIRFSNTPEDYASPGGRMPCELKIKFKKSNTIKGI